ncbi:unnamed protein product [Linum trigynum]|uniref:Reverse transcriptase domain-containing protein n=1 Tax=Linum trigynum TaxID=586398 RepID=A0AAV2CG38_9ROSI
MQAKGGKVGWMVLKIDLAKAYDRIKWSFVLDTLEAVGAPRSFTELTMSCITSASMQIQWNGGLTEPFSPSRGLRQGCPLSPYIFTLCMERLGHLIDAAVEAGEWQPIRLSQRGPKLSHLFFADDLILFSVASMEQVQVISKCLENFGLASGQEISRPKLRIFFSHNVSNVVETALSAALDIPVTKNLGRYLGVPVIHGRVSKATYTNLIDRIDSRLAGWKVNSLSLAGRITLAQAVLSSLPAYTMQTALLPAYVREYIDKKIRGFIWGSSEQGRKVHLVDWETLYRPKAEGGLGLRSATRMNDAFMLKIAWRLFVEQDSIWAQVIRGKYLREVNGIWYPPRNGRLSNLWRGVLRVLHHIPGGTMWNIRSGMQAMFWYDRWLQDGPPLKEFALNLPEEANNLRVAEVVLNGEWNLEYVKAFLTEPLVLQLQLHPIPEGMEPDVPTWRFSESGKFTVKSAAELLREEEEGSEEHPAWRAVWKIQGPQRTRSFFWLVLHGRLLTNGERQRRHLALSDACRICGSGPETVIHVLRDCSYARHVWSHLLEGEPDSIVFQEEVRKWALHYLTGRSNVIEQSVFAILCWQLWRNRNLWVFEEQLASAEQLIHAAKLLSNQAKEAFEVGRSIVQGDSASETRLICWQRPPPGWVCVNSDGSVVLAQGSSAAGGVIRDSDGRFVIAYAVNLGGGSVTSAELAGIAHGLQLAWDRGHRQVIVQTDSSTALAIIQAADIWHHNGIAHHTMVSYIRSLLARDWEVSLGHVFREANFVADHVASEAHSLPVGVHVIENPSLSLHYWLYFDSIGFKLRDRLIYKG